MSLASHVIFTRFEFFVQINPCIKVKASFSMKKEGTQLLCTTPEAELGFNIGEKVRKSRQTVIELDLLFDFIAL